VPCPFHEPVRVPSTSPQCAEGYSVSEPQLFQILVLSDVIVVELPPHIGYFTAARLPKRVNTNYYVTLQSHPTPNCGFLIGCDRIEVAQWTCKNARMVRTGLTEVALQGGRVLTQKCAYERYDISSYAGDVFRKRVGRQNVGFGYDNFFDVIFLFADVVGLAIFTLFAIVVTLIVPSSFFLVAHIPSPIVHHSPVHNLEAPESIAQDHNLSLAKALRVKISCCTFMFLRGVEHRH
jgi:hypothetical protein